MEAWLPTSWQRRLIRLVGGALPALLSLLVLEQFLERLLPLPGRGIAAFTLAVLALSASVGPVFSTCARAADRSLFRDPYAFAAAIRRLLTSARPGADPMTAAEAMLEQARRALGLDWLVLVAERDGTQTVAALAASSPERVWAELAVALGDSAPSIGNGRQAAIRLTLDAGGSSAVLLVGLKGKGERVRAGDRELLDVLAALLAGHLARAHLLERLPGRTTYLEQQRAKPRQATESERRAAAGLSAPQPARLPLVRPEAADGTHSPPRTGAALTEREREVLALLGIGASNAAIAERLSLSIRTIEDVAAHLLRKLGLESRCALVAYAANAALPAVAAPVPLPRRFA